MNKTPDENDFQPLDGNAAAGVMGELFAFDITTASIMCGGCGIVAQIAEARVYGGEMGSILRCARCDTAVVRIVRTHRGIWYDMRGAQHLFVPDRET